MVPAGVDPEQYVLDGSELELRERLLVNDEEYLIGYVGRVAEEKGLDTLLRALAALSNVPWRLVVVGSGPDERTLRDQAERLGLEGRITQEGYVPHTSAPTYLSACDVVVLPSLTRPNWKEQFGRVLIEAAAAGTPVVGSDSGEIPNVIRSTKGGLIFPEGDHTALASCLARLFDDEALRQSLGARGSASVSESYTDLSLASKLAVALENAVQLGGHGKRAGVHPQAAALDEPDVD